MRLARISARQGEMELKRGDRDRVGRERSVKFFLKMELAREMLYA